MRVALLLTVLGVTHGATLTLTPPVIYDCSGPHGKASLSWSASGPVRLVVGPANIPMTNLGGTSGSAETGTWVSDGLEFRLLNASGGVEALAVAKVRCNAGDLPANGIVSNSFFPLEVGNTWIYKTDSRAFTSDYWSWKVTNQVQLGGRTYSEISVIAATFTTPGYLFLREDSDGVIWRCTGTAGDPKETIYLNPKTERHAAFSNSLGNFPDAIFQTVQVPLQRDELVFVRGVGLATQRGTMLTGSSGGFTSSLELVEVRLATGPHIAVSSPRIGVVAESARLDVTNHLVTNCAIPCYFAACGLGSPVDPPNTYKPCTRTRIEANAAVDFFAELTLLNSAGQAVYRTPAIAASPGELIRYVQVPLYSEPNKPLPAGQYKLVGRVSVGTTETATSSMTIEIQ
ncbi:MAG: hypothetical protein ABI811_20065 [Acidobacteriota bacterium]